ncbi:hypothetical protein EDD29_6980 [Actinocorallia herbida]|uniref:Uncharacterized protein n=1 Tax=Actinocorallia herbida TaxID=58109 RepID=A0A3N1D6Y5_9ACTN|nr:hypothetical protein [Actinocorallia herbida]ROO89291.1 hypothetical protein EDD29_6980 [Actinocorallia herbida]
MRTSVCSAFMPEVHFGLLVLATVAGGTLTLSGTPLGEAFIIVMATLVGGVEVSRRVTGSLPWVRIRIAVVILILVLVVGLIVAGFPPLIVVLGLLATADAVAGAARRLTTPATVVPLTVFAA